MLRLFRALNQYRQIRTANEADRLRYVFGTVAAMGSERYNSTRSTYLSSPLFCELIQHEPGLTDKLESTDYLSTMPQGSLGQAMYELKQSKDVDYVKFLSEYEGAGLQTTNDGLLKKYNNRERDLHDLIHILFDYERTRFGEAATILTQYWQGGPSGFAVIAYAGVIRYAFVRPRYLPLVLRAIYGVWKRQRGTDIRSYQFEFSLEKPLWQVRKEIGIKPKSSALEQVLTYTRWQD